MAKLTREQRFWAKVDKSGDCWVWTGNRSGNYGKFWLDGRKQWAHRVSYEMETGPVPAGLVLDHLCRVPLCVKPEHLEAVTQHVNALRGDSGKHQAVKTHCPTGHPYDEQNTKLYQGRRYCRACHRADNARRKRRQRESMRVGT